MARDPGVKHRPPAADTATALWLQHQQELHRFLMRRLRHAQDARDLAQEVYLRLLRVTHREALHDFRAYMYRIASHVVYEYRHRTREPHVDFDSEVVQQWDEAATDFSDEPFERLSNEQQLEEFFGRLNPHYRAVFALHEGEGLTCQQIAQRMQLSTHTVRKYLTRIISALRNENWNAGMERRRP
jgi:RNA polymerase sigma-70 factor (ECF subfamily)